MNHRILVAEDNQTNMKILKMALQDSGYDILAATNGKAAWELLEESDQPVSVIILDWMMPEMNGMEVMAKLKKDKRFSNIPVIMQTAKAQKDNIIEGIEEGAFQYLTKPFDEDVLISMVNSAVEEYERYVSVNREADDKINSIREYAMNVIKTKVGQKKGKKDSESELQKLLVAADEMNGTIKTVVSEIQGFVIPTLEGILPDCEESDIILETLLDTVSNLNKGTKHLNSAIS